jgi:hypothetical protein
MRKTLRGFTFTTKRESVRNNPALQLKILLSDNNVLNKCDSMSGMTWRGSNALATGTKASRVRVGNYFHCAGHIATLYVYRGTDFS